MDRYDEMAAEALNQAESPRQQAWPPLISLDTPNLPRLSGDELPSWAGNYAKALAKATETPPELAVAMILASCATACAQYYWVQVGQGYSEPTNLWLAAALPPGNRKSAVQVAASAPLLSWEREEAKRLEPEIKRIASEIRTKEARIKELRTRSVKAESSLEGEKLSQQAADLEAEMPILPRPPQLWTSDATPEHLGTLLGANNERMAWLSSEGGIFELLGGRYSSGIPNLDLVLKAHGGDPERVDRGSRPPVYLQQPLLCIGLSPQPEVLKGLTYKPGFRGRGLLGRFLFLLPPSPLGYRLLEPNHISQQLEAEYCSNLYSILDTQVQLDESGRRVPIYLKLSSEAHAEWRNFAKMIEESMRPGSSFEHATDWAGKAPGAALKLAGVLHVIEHAQGTPANHHISSQTMQRALNLMAVICQHSLHALELMGTDSNIAAARTIWRWVESGRRSQFSVRDVHQALKGSFPRVKEVRAALEVLDERGYVEVSDPLTSGLGRKPSPTVTVRPDIVAGWR